MFRNYKNSIPVEDRFTLLFEVVGDKIVKSNTSVSLPSSTDYCLEDLLASGVKVAPVDTTVVHDASTTNAVAHDFINNYVEPSNNEEK